MDPAFRTALANIMACPFGMVQNQTCIKLLSHIYPKTNFAAP